MTKLMYKVFTGNGIVMFEEKAQAEQYVELLEESKEWAILNSWTWETTIED